MARMPRTLALAVVSAATLVMVAAMVDVGAAVRAMAAFRLETVSLAVILLATGLLVSGVRYRLVLSALGLDIPWGLAMRANLVGIVGGLVFFHIVGQTLARAAVLGRYGIGGPAVLVANVYERATALLSLVGLAVLGSVYLFGGLTFNLGGGGGDLLKLALVGILVAAAVVAGVDRRLLRPLTRALARGRVLAGAARVALATLALHGTTLAAFVTLGRALAPGIDLADLAAASLLVMLAASLPVSFAGWGVREISAVYALGAIGMDETAALAVSVTVGAISLLLASLLGSAAALSAPRPSAMPAAAPAPAVRAKALAIGHLLGLALPLMAGALVVFQVHVPTATGKLNVNLADPLAIAGGLVFLARYVRLPDRRGMWASQSMEALLLGGLALIALAFLNGVARFGMTDWAFTNRLVGWLVLLGYVGTGALAFATAGELGRLRLLKTVLVATSAVAVAEIGLLSLLAAGAPVRTLLSDGQLTGMAQNSNAFALQIVLALAIVGVVPAERHGRAGLRINETLREVAIAVLLVAIFYVRSRTGYVLAPLCLAACIGLGTLRPMAALRGCLWAAAGVLGVMVVGLLAPHVAAALGLSAGQWSTGLDTQFVPRLTHAASDGERWMSIVRGLEMWLAHPVIGAGLGAFVRQAAAETGSPLVIHNTAVWLLAETGLVGLVAVAGAVATVLTVAWQGRHAASPAARVLLVALLTICLAQMVHDVFYQRLFWLLLGATMVSARFHQAAAQRSLAFDRKRAAPEPPAAAPALATAR